MQAPSADPPAFDATVQLSVQIGPEMFWAFTD